MKKIFCVLMCLVLVLAMAGCGGDSSSEEPEATKTEVQGETETEASEGSGDAIDYEKVDVDLTLLSSTMVYSEVYNMMVSPFDYLGKTVKAEGFYRFFHNETNDKYYFAVIIEDATACCAQGLEFVPTDDYVYPDDYPELDEWVTVIGTFDTYEEDGQTYCTLRNAKMIRG